MPGQQTSTPVRLRVAAAAAVLVVAVPACAGSPEAGPTEEDGTEVVVLAEDSWSIPAELEQAFERQNGAKLDIRDAGSSPRELADALTGSDDAAEADVVLGIDATIASEVLDADVLEPYTSPDANTGQQRFSIDDRQRLSAVELADSCVNVDVEWFDERDRTPPADLADLAESRYADLLVVPSPVTSAQGQSFLFATVAEHGDGWQQYWRRLLNNGVSVAETAGAAYTENFTAGSDGDNGDAARPLVVARASAPARDAAEDSDTEVLPDTCYRQPRYAGLLSSASNVDDAQKLIDFLLSQQYQAAVPEEHGSYPTREDVDLPEGWSDTAPLQDEPPTLSPQQLADGKQRWLARWRSLSGQ